MLRLIFTSIFSALLLVFLSLNSFSQQTGNRNIDSLSKILITCKEDTNKVNILNELSYTYYNVNPDKGIEIGMYGLKLAESLHWNKGVAIANNKIGINYWAKSDYVKAIEYDLKALSIVEKLKDKSNMANILVNVGLVYDEQGKYQEALEYYQKALNYYEEINDKKGKAKDLGNIGILYTEISNHPKALESYFKALKIAEEVGDKNLIATNLGNIGNDYKFQHKYDMAIEYGLKALKTFEALNSKDGMAMNYRNIGEIYRLKNDFAHSLEYFSKAIIIFTDLGNKNNLALTQSDIGNLLFEQNKFEDALKLYFKALKINQSLGITNEIALNLGNIGNSYLEIYKSGSTLNLSDSLIPKNSSQVLAKSIEYLQKSISLSKEINYYEAIIMFSNELAHANKLKGDYKSAYLNLNQYIQIKDSVYSAENSLKITKLEEQRNKELREINEKLKELKKRNERIFTVIGFLFLIVIIFSIFRNYKTQQKSNKLLTIEKKRSDDLLLNILPAEVAEELKNKGSAEAKHFDEVSVLFTDFKGFTKLSEKLTAQELVFELNICFKAFDAIMGKYAIEKIKTIGDAYLAVSGLPIPNSNHAENIVFAAIDIQQFMQERKKQLGDNTFEIRIGINSGSVVAGIVGDKKFAYDIWGDTVNTAARMEQKSEAGKINISQTTYELIKDKFHCIYRGEIEAKNKGALKMYFIEKIL